MDSQVGNSNNWPNWDEQLSFSSFPGFSTGTGIPSVFAEEERKEIGQEPVVQIFYEGPEKCECCINWVERRPKEVPEIAQGKYDQAAVRMYKRKDHKSSVATTGGLIALRDHSIIVQSQLLIELIRPSLLSIGYFMPKKGNVKFQAPFKELFFAYDKLLKVGWTLHDESEKAHLELLTSSLEPIFRSISSNVIRMRSTKTIDFENLWTLYPTNTIVYRKINRVEWLYQVLETKTLYDHLAPRSEESAHDNKKAKKDESFGRERALQISCQTIGFDGVNFGALKVSPIIYRFDGVVPIKDLEIYPAIFHKDPTIGRKLAARSRNILSFQRNVHCEYKGSARAAIAEEYGQDEHLNGKVMVDAFGFGKKYPEEAPICEQLEHRLSRHGANSSDAQPWDTHNPSSEDQPSEDTFPWLDAFFDRPSLEHQTSNLHFFRRNPQYLMIMKPSIPGFSFDNNRWFHLDISKLSPISWMPNPLDRLVLKQSIKEVVLAFAKKHFESLQFLDKIVVPKGQGLVLLLTGPPGTGKTMIAEATAEEARLPLYRIHAGELGSYPSTIEIRLREILELATEWKAIVLLDEADTFIGVRERMDRTAGEIVSIFLRQLEYFKGMICLTSNIPHDIDPALKSRCRLNIQFKNLTPESRREVWRLNLETRGAIAGYSGPESTVKAKVELSMEDWNRLKDWNLNGREIHNVVENVILWSLYSSAEINLTVIERFITFTVPDASKNPKRSDESLCGAVSSADVLEEQLDYTSSGKRPRADAVEIEEGTMERGNEPGGKRPRLSTDT